MTRRVFVHDVFSLDYVLAIAARHPELDAYAERAILLAKPDDVVCVLEPVDPEYLHYLERLGVGPRPGRVVSLAGGPFPPGSRLTSLLAEDAAALGRLRELVADGVEALELHPFVSTRREAELASDLGARLGAPVRVRGGPPQVVAEADRKDAMRARARELGVPLAEGEVVSLGTLGARSPSAESDLEAAIVRRARVTGRAILRGTRGAWGTSTRVTGGGPRDARRIAQEVCASWAGEAVVVESFLDSVVSPNIAMVVERPPGPVRCAGLTDQRLEESLIHAGNFFPSTASTLEAMVGSATVLAESLQSAGYEGWVGFDFVEHRDVAGGELRHVLAEVNPRVNGAVYPLVLLATLNRTRSDRGRPPIAAFLSATVATGARSFTEVRKALGTLLFDLEREWGVVPYTTGSLAHGKIAFVALGKSRDEVETLHAGASRALEMR